MLDLQKNEAYISKLNKGKIVDFLDKFGDLWTIKEKDTWNISESKVLEKLHLRTKFN